MTLTEVANELRTWRPTKYKAVTLCIGVGSLLFLEFVARAYYRPFIYSKGIFDFHIADTLGNSLGTVAGIFVLMGIFTSSWTQGLYMVKVVTIAFVLYEIGQPLLGRPIDPWDVLATLVTGVVCYTAVARVR